MDTKGFRKGYLSVVAEPPCRPGSRGKEPKNESGNQGNRNLPKAMEVKKGEGGAEVQDQKSEVRVYKTYSDRTRPTAIVIAIYILYVWQRR